MKMIDLQGKRFGRLVVLKKAESQTTPNGSVKTMWECRCDCGNVVVRSSQNLRNASCPSCGCKKQEETSERRLTDLSGKQFGRLTVLKRVFDSTKAVKWLCQCSCGNECVVLASNLVRGHTKSCGCYRDETRVSNKLIHGYRKTRIYSVWEKLKSRCLCETNPSYPRYGGRGITICDEWKNSPEAFIKWAYENGYRDDAEFGECTVDRINNDKGYSPENCRITNELVQANNRRSSKWIEYNGERHTLAVWARILDIPYSTICGGLINGIPFSHYANGGYKPRNTHH